MTARVWKYVVPMPDERSRSFIPMPLDVVLLSVGIQDGKLVVWVLVGDGWDGLADSPCELIVTNTGHPVPDFPDAVPFLGTATSPSGVVWHVWDAGFWNRISEREASDG